MPLDISYYRRIGSQQEEIPTRKHYVHMWSPDL